MLLPLIQPAAEASTPSRPMAREILWDAERKTSVWRGGVPLIVTGKEAVKSWAYRALQIPRYRYAAFSLDYGNECEHLIGTAYSEALKKAEAARYVEECLMQNSYINSVDNVEVDFSEGTITVSAVIQTIYGEVALYV